MRVSHATQSTQEPITLVDLLHNRGICQPEKLAYTFLVDGDTTTVSLTYAELDRQARAVGALLQDVGATGKRVLLLYPAGLEYIRAFFGCLYAGAVAVPGYQPRFQRSLERMQSLATDAGATFALTTASLWGKTQQWSTMAPELANLRWFITDELAEGIETSWQEPDINRHTLAMLQYTSGSTSRPKGVMLHHEHLLYNAHRIRNLLGHTEQSVGVGWLPLHHDMGLLGNVLQPLYAGFPCILMSPMAFLQRPIRWLQAISRYQASTSGGPNFAYDICARKITQAQRATLDLSCWDVALNGAEPIRPTTLEQFASRFASCGFRREAFYPCYGLAEATLMVSGGTKAATPVVRTVHKASLEQHQRAIPCIGAAGAQSVVGCGKSLTDQTIIIVDPDTRIQCPANEVGEIWLAGRSVAQGYWNQPQATQDTFQAHLADTNAGPFLRTGDLGFLHQDELFLSGRLQDAIVIRGRNHYPQDLEATVEQSHPCLRLGCGAAIAVEMGGEERLVIIQEIERHVQAQLSRQVAPPRGQEEGEVPQPFDVDTIIGNICQAVAEKHDVQVSAVVLLRPGGIPKTSSGKIQRHACRAGFFDQTLDVMAQWKISLLSADAGNEPPPREEEHARRQFTSTDQAPRQQGGHVA